MGDGPAGEPAAGTEFVRRQGFGHLVAAGRDRELPVVVIRDGRAHHLPRGRAAHRGHRGRRRPDGKAAILRRQLGVTEPGSGAADPLEHGRRLTGIRGLRLAVREVRAKFKYGGNVDAEHRAAVATRLAERNGPGDPAALEHLRRRMPIR